MPTRGAGQSGGDWLKSGVSLAHQHPAHNSRNSWRAVSMDEHDTLHYPAGLCMPCKQSIDNSVYAGKVSFCLSALKRRMVGSVTQRLSAAYGSTQCMVIRRLRAVLAPLRSCLHCLPAVLVLLLRPQLGVGAWAPFFAPLPAYLFPRRSPDDWQR